MAHRVISPSVLYVGTPVFLVGTRNPDGTSNIAPASSHFSLGPMIVVGLEEGGQSLENVRREGELTVNFLSAPQWIHAERLAGVTGADPVPDDKAGAYEYEPAKFARAGLTPVDSELIGAQRVAEAPLQCEAEVRRITPGVEGIYALVEARVLRVHVEESIAFEGTDYVDPEAWHPLIYSFRHFYDRGAEVGWTRKSTLAPTPERVARWEEFGGEWRIAYADARSARIELRRCDGGEIVETIEATAEQDPHLVRWAAVQRAAGRGVR